MQKIKVKRYLVLLGVITIVLVIAIILVLIQRENNTYTQSYIESGNVFISNNSRSNPKQLTTDGSTSKGTKYDFTFLSKDNNVYYIKCIDSLTIGDNTKCSAEKINIETNKVTNLYDLSTVNYINPTTIVWNKNTGELVFASRDNLYLASNDGIKSILHWNMLDLGIGGNFCTGTKFSDDYKYFYFCDASAVGLSIQGKIYLFDSAGAQVKNFSPSIDKKGLGLVSPSFSNNSFNYKDTTNGKDYSYKLSN